MGARPDDSSTLVPLNYRAPTSPKEWRWLRKTPGFVGPIVVGSLCTALSIIALAAFLDVAESRAELGIGVAISSLFGAIGIGLLMCAIFVQRKWSSKVAVGLLQVALLSFVAFLVANLLKALQGESDHLLGVIVIAVILIFPTAMALSKISQQIREDDWFNS